MWRMKRCLQASTLLLVLLSGTACAQCPADMQKLVDAGRNHDVSRGKELPAELTSFMRGRERDELTAELRRCGFKVNEDAWIPKPSDPAADRWLYATRGYAKLATLFLVSRELRVIAGSEAGKITSAKAYAFLHGP